MVSLSQVHASNSKIRNTLRPDLVAVFVGATSGIGEYTLKAFAKRTSQQQPRVFLVGRSHEAGQRIKAECEALCPGGSFTFISSDVALLKNVDEVCRTIQSEVKVVNLLVLSQGTLVFGTETQEGLHYAGALIHHSRMRFVVNLLPLLRNASSLRRVVSVFAGTKEGHLDVSDIQGRKVPMYAARGHAASLVTFGLEALSKQAPEVGFVHVFPGFVKSGIARGTTGILMGIFKVVSEITGYFKRMDTGECGERHLYLCTSQRYAGASTTESDGIEIDDKLEFARGTNGKTKSGVYSVQEHGESADVKVEKVLADMRTQGVVEKVWETTMEDFRRICSSEHI